MGNLPETTTNILLSSLMGFLGGLLTIPINAIVTWALKRDELSFKHRLDLIAKKQELILQYKLDMQKSEVEAKRVIHEKAGNTQ